MGAKFLDLIFFTDNTKVYSTVIFHFSFDTQIGFDSDFQALLTSTFSIPWKFTERMRFLLRSFIDSMATLSVLFINPTLDEIQPASTAFCVRVTWSSMVMSATEIILWHITCASCSSFRVRPKVGWMFSCLRLTISAFPFA